MINYQIMLLITALTALPVLALLPEDRKPDAPAQSVAAESPAKEELVINPSKTIKWETAPAPSGELVFRNLYWADHDDTHGEILIGGQCPKYVFQFGENREAIEIIRSPGEIEVRSANKPSVIEKDGKWVITFKPTQ